MNNSRKKVALCSSREEDENTIAMDTINGYQPNEECFTATGMKHISDKYNKISVEDAINFIKGTIHEAAKKGAYSISVDGNCIPPGRFSQFRQYFENKGFKMYYNYFDDECTISWLKEAQTRSDRL